MAGRSTESLERMKDKGERNSINRHFWREGVIQAAIPLAIAALALLMAFLGPWLYQILR